MKRDIPMPTENRSSNTEMVSVPEGFMLVERSIWTEQQVEAATACITRLKSVPTMTDRALAMAAIDAAQCSAPEIALSDLMPAPQPQAEPVAHARICGVEFDSKGNTVSMEIGVDNMPVPRKVELGEQLIFLDDHRREVERLRAALKFYADREHYHFDSGNLDTVSGEPLNILWCGDEPDFIEDGSVARAALSASAEPEAKS